MSFFIYFCRSPPSSCSLYPSEAFDALKTAADILTDDDARAALDAELLDLPLDSLTLQELRWSRQLAGLAEAEEDGEVRGADAVLESARAYAAAEKALAVGLVSYRDTWFQCIHYIHMLQQHWTRAAVLVFHTHCFSRELDVV